MYRIGGSLPKPAEPVHKFIQMHLGLRKYYQQKWTLLGWEFDTCLVAGNIFSVLVVLCQSMSCKDDFMWKHVQKRSIGFLRKMAAEFVFYPFNPDFGRWKPWGPRVILPEHHLGVSENYGTPKSSILIGSSIINHPFWGTPIFGNIHFYNCSVFWCGSFPPNL